MTSNQASSKGLNQKYCFEDKNIFLKGFYDEPEMKNIWISLSRCSNTTENNNTCKSDEEIDEFFEKSNYFSTYYPNQVIDLEDHSDAIKDIWRNNYILIDLNTLKNLIIFMKKVDFIDDSNLPFRSEEIHHTKNFEKLENDFIIKKRSPEI
jgi:hypothetical protein